MGHEPADELVFELILKSIVEDGGSTEGAM